MSGRSRSVPPAAPPPPPDRLPLLPRSAADEQPAVAVEFAHSNSQFLYRGFWLPRRDPDQHYRALRDAWETMQRSLPGNELSAAPAQLRVRLHDNTPYEVVRGLQRGALFRALAQSRLDAVDEAALVQFMPRHLRRVEALLLGVLESWAMTHEACPEFEAGAAHHVEYLSAALTRVQAGDAERVPHTELLRHGRQLHAWLREHERLARGEPEAPREQHFVVPLWPPAQPVEHIEFAEAAFADAGDGARTDSDTEEDVRRAWDGYL